MKLFRFSQLNYVPASHEDHKNPGNLKKVLIQKDDLIDGRVQMVNWAKIPVGKAFRAHYHEDMQEVFIIISGKVKIKGGIREAILHRGDVVIIEPKERHKMTNIGRETVYYLVFGISQGKNGRTIII